MKEIAGLPSLYFWKLVFCGGFLIYRTPAQEVILLFNYPVCAHSMSKRVRWLGLGYPSPTEVFFISQNQFFLHFLQTPFYRGTVPQWPSVSKTPHFNQWMLLPHQPSGQPERLPDCLSHFYDTSNLWEKSLGFLHTEAEGTDSCKFKVEKKYNISKHLPLQAVHSVLPQLGSNLVSWRLHQYPWNKERTTLSVNLQHKSVWRIQIPIQSLHIGVCM